MYRRILNRRSLVTIAVALAAGTASAAGVGYAQGNGASGGTSTVSSGAPGGILAGVHSALENLVSQGMISQQQADAVQQEADAGSIDPKTLVQSGVISDAQMRVVASGIDQLKQAAG
jgi:hypothetical protein